MGFGLGLIAAIAVGLPLLAVAVVNRLPPPRLRQTQPEPVYSWARRHHLGGLDQMRVTDAVVAGRRVQPEHLVSAAREYAELVLSRSAPAPWQRRPMLWSALATVYLALVVVVIWKAPSAIGGFVVLPVSVVSTYRRTKNARRALAANQDGADPDLVNQRIRHAS